jgi:hypothetical protein
MEHPDCRRSCNNKVRQDFILVPKLAQIRTYQLSSIPLPIWIQFGRGGDVGVATVTYGDQLMCGKIIKLHQHDTPYDHQTRKEYAKRN